MWFGVISSKRMVLWTILCCVFWTACGPTPRAKYARLTSLESKIVASNLEEALRRVVPVTIPTSGTVRGQLSEADPVMVTGSYRTYYEAYRFTIRDSAAACEIKIRCDAGDWGRTKHMMFPMAYMTDSTAARIELQLLTVVGEKGFLHPYHIDVRWSSPRLEPGHYNIVVGSDNSKVGRTIGNATASVTQSTGRFVSTYQVPFSVEAYPTGSFILDVRLHSDPAKFVQKDAENLVPEMRHSLLAARTDVDTTLAAVLQRSSKKTNTGANSQVELTADSPSLRKDGNLTYYQVLRLPLTRGRWVVRVKSEPHSFDGSAFQTVVPLLYICDARGVRVHCTLDDRGERSIGDLTWNWRFDTLEDGEYLFVVGADNNKTGEIIGQKFYNFALAELRASPTGIMKVRVTADRSDRDVPR